MAGSPFKEPQNQRVVNLLQAPQLPGSLPTLHDQQLTCPVQENEHDPQSSSPEEVYCGPSALVRGFWGGQEDLSGAIVCAPCLEVHNDEPEEGRTNILTQYSSFSSSR
uniref:Uncharacterized protein n=1 Tax=Micrurus spixii TaxID=129469 RepID=A0A2D4N612_9SAUR